ncbi:hypothetical protein DH09_11545 [Bacillaceae bacterium JMAK1]|nr:hypothetical protein DH09_11545 [Bacillaceae bacterium JMAK1]
MNRVGIVTCMLLASVFFFIAGFLRDTFEYATPIGFPVATVFLIAAGYFILRKLKEPNSQ